MHGLLAHSSILVSPAERKRGGGRERKEEGENERKMDQNCEKLEIIRKRKEAKEKMKREKRMVVNQENMLLQSGLERLFRREREKKRESHRKEGKKGIVGFNC